MRAESAVEPTRSENITVTWRRSARSSGDSPGATGRGLHVSGGRLERPYRAQRSDGIEELAAVSNNGDAEVLEVLRRQIGQNRLVYLILAECRLILPEAQAPQPNHDVHGSAHNRWWRYHHLKKIQCPARFG